MTNRNSPTHIQRKRRRQRERELWEFQRNFVRLMLQCHTQRSFVILSLCHVHVHLSAIVNFQSNGSLWLKHKIWIQGSLSSPNMQHAGKRERRQGSVPKKKSTVRTKGKTPKQIKLVPYLVSSPLSSSHFYFSLPHPSPLSLSTHFAASFSLHLPLLASIPSVSFCLPLCWADRQRQGNCCRACSLTLSAHKSLSTACMSPLHSSPPSFHSGGSGGTHWPASKGLVWLAKPHGQRWMMDGWWRER